MKIKLMSLIAGTTLLASACCGGGDSAPVRKDLCIQMYSARSLINHDNYKETPRSNGCAVRAVKE